MTKERLGRQVLCSVTKLLEWPHGGNVERSR
jgi:hypothetical protein